MTDYSDEDDEVAAWEGRTSGRWAGLRPEEREAEIMAAAQTLFDQVSQTLQKRTDFSTLMEGRELSTEKMGNLRMVHTGQRDDGSYGIVGSENQAPIGGDLPIEYDPHERRFKGSGKDGPRMVLIKFLSEV